MNYDHDPTPSLPPSPTGPQPPPKRSAWFNRDTMLWEWTSRAPLDLSWTQGGLAGLALALCHSFCMEGPRGEVVAPIGDSRGLWVYQGKLWSLVETGEIAARLDSWDSKALLVPADPTARKSAKYLVVTAARAAAARRCHEITPRMWKKGPGWFESLDPCLAVGDEAVRADLTSGCLVKESLCPEHGARTGYPALTLGEARAPRWEAYLDGLFAGNESIIDYLETWCGPRSPRPRDGLTAPRSAHLRRTRDGEIHTRAHHPRALSSIIRRLHTTSIVARRAHRRRT